MDIIGPVGCTATVFVPTKEGQAVTLAAEIDTDYVVKVEEEFGYTRYEVESGKYGFSVQ
jgi:hypothetical protein